VVLIVASGRRRWTARLLNGAVVLAALVGGAAASALATGPATSVVGTRTVAVTISTTPIVTVPQSFLGLSVEYPELQAFEQMPGFVKLIKLLEPPGAGPLNLRIGGQSADATYWHVRFHVPPQAYLVTPAWILSLARLTVQARISVMLDLNIAAQWPEMEATFAGAAAAALPKGSISALEIGNEPDLFRLGGSLAGVHLSPTGQLIGYRRVRHYTLNDYMSEFSAYATDLTMAAPGIPLAGPSTDHTHPGWIGALGTTFPGTIGLATVHHYPFLSCALPGASNYPTVMGYLTPKVQERFAGGLGKARHAAALFGLPLRVSEFGDAACGGIPGVTDSFATALWGLNTLFDLLRRHIAGVNVHMRPMWVNSALTPELPGNPVRPLFYGLAVFAQALGPDPTLLSVTPAKLDPVRVWAVSVTGGLRIVLINEGAKSRLIDVTTPAPLQDAEISVLKAPSPYSTDGLTFGGQSIGADGEWHGRARVRAADCTVLVCEVRVAPYSAALLNAGMQETLRGG
jgi:hypothetical protein